MPGAQFAQVGNTRRWWNEQGNWSKQMDDIISGYLTTVPETQMSAYDTLANEGIFGESGINYVLRGAPQEMALKRQRLMGTLGRKLGSRLGPRAGGTANLLAANQVFAPLFEEELAMGRDLRLKNVMSKLEGLYGRDRVLQIMASLYKQKDKNQGKMGFLDVLKGLTGVASAGMDIFGGTGGMASAANQKIYE